MLTAFGKVFVFFLLGIIFVAAALIVAAIIRPKKPTSEKLTTYECGEDPIGSPWVRFNIRFYVVALIFLLFDVELVLLFPWALVFKDLGMYAYVAGAVFIIVLFVADFYLWAKGDLEWVRPAQHIPVLRDIVDHAPPRDVVTAPKAEAGDVPAVEPQA